MGEPRRAAEWTVGSSDGKHVVLRMSCQTLTPREAARLRNQLTEILLGMKGLRGDYAYTDELTRKGMAVIRAAAQELGDA